MQSPVPETAGSRVAVAVRIRPKIFSATNSAQVAERYCAEAAAKTSDTTIRLVDAKAATTSGSGSNKSGSSGVRSQVFSFDSVFDKECTQEEVYEETTLDAVDAALQSGSCSTIITYGQTGSGKTYTVLGLVAQNPLVGDDVVVSDTGLFLRVLRDVLAYRDARKASSHVVVSLTVVEIYLEAVRDLLGNGATMKVLIDADTVKLPDLVYKEISTLRDGTAAYKEADSKRVSRATNSNDTSSRSHAMFTIDVFQQPCTDDNPQPLPLQDLLNAKERGKKVSVDGSTLLSVGAGKPAVMHSTIVLTDLAGSEKMKAVDGKSSEALDELKKINGSLTSLGNVVHALHAGAKHIPYRDSKLTVMLRSSFTMPSSRIVLIANVAPTTLTFDETLSSLFFANKVKAMKPTAASTTDFSLESDYLASLRVAEELCAELRVAQVATDMPLASARSVGAAAPAVPASRRVKHAAPLLREAATSTSTADITVVNAELEVLRKRTFDDAVSQATRARAVQERHLEEAEGDRRDIDHGDADKALQRLATDLSDEEAVDARRAISLAELRQRVDELPALLNTTGATKAKVDAEYEVLEESFAKKYAPEESAWAAAEVQRRSRDDLHVATARLKRQFDTARDVRSGFLLTQNDVLAAFDDAEESQHAWERLEAETWISGVLLNVVHNAMVIAEKKIIAERAKEAMAARRAMRADTDIDNTPPASPTAVGGARPPPPPPRKASAHADPNELSTSRGDAPALPKSRPAAKKPSPVPSDSDAVPSSPRAPPKRPAPKKPAAPDIAESTVFDSPTLVTDVVSYMKDGCSLLKHGRSGKPHFRYFHLSSTPGAGEDDGTHRLHWCAEKSEKSSSNTFIDLRSVTAVSLGRATPVFTRSKKAEDFFVSFSLHYIAKQEQRTLDLVANDDSEFEAWVIGICHLSRCNPAFGPPVEMITDALAALPAVDQVLCKQWRIRPSLLTAVRHRIADIAKRKRAKTVRMSPGTLRFLSQVDIFRATALWRHLVEAQLVASADRFQNFLDFDGSAA
jgi:hypothetical protein